MSIKMFEIFTSTPKRNYGAIKQIVNNRLENSLIEIGKKTVRYKEITPKDIELLTHQDYMGLKGAGRYCLTTDNARFDLISERGHYRKSIRTPDNYIETIYYKNSPYIIESKIKNNERFSTSYENNEIINLSENNYEKNTKCRINKLKNGNIETIVNQPDNVVYKIVHDKNGKLISLSETSSNSIYTLNS